MSAVLPPAVSESALARAIDAFGAALGAEKVLTDAVQLREFRDPFQHPSSHAYSASVVLMPTTVEEIQEILRIANETGLPLWTHGQGRNNGYGGPAPRVAGSAIVSLRNMNRVLEINEELRSCARGWARCPTTRRGTATSAASGRRPISCSCSPTSGSSRRWATG